MKEEIVRTPILVNTDEREADIDTRIARAKALGSVIVRFFEQREYAEDAVCQIKFFSTTFTNNKVMEALQFADEMLRSKGYIMIISLQVEEENIQEKESNKKLSDRKCTINIAVRNIELTKEFQDAIKSAISQVA